ncbi:hypothetical protein DFJ63DRAFT_144800 [Scheffersomyces coipomensis]|uniref:uncharacterized protein n=1 Tax=Scheffersomyces coipomensis TaxID=1788519 RepID=UPI00315C8CB7
MAINKQLFDQYLDEFNDVLLDTLMVVNSTSVLELDLKVLVNFTKTNPSYSYTRIELTNIAHSLSIGVEFTVSFHELYNVPIFYFRLIENGQLIMYDDQLVHRISRLLKFDISVQPFQIELHHILQQPWLCSHICQSEQFMDQFIKSIPDSSKTKYSDISTILYLKSWFAVYGLSGLYPRLSLRD